MIDVASQSELTADQKSEPGRGADCDALEVEVARDFAFELPSWQAASDYVSVRDPRWLKAICEGLNHKPYFVTALRGKHVVGGLPLALTQSLLFGRHLVSLPYVNWSGVLADDAQTARALVDRAAKLANELEVRYLELRHERPLTHEKLDHCSTNKVHMRLPLPSESDRLWSQFKPKVRNQIRKAGKKDLTIHWGGAELLSEFYRVFSVNMRDLGTPVYGRRLFQSILSAFGADAELCVVRLDRRPVAAAILVHAGGVTEVPSASSLRRSNHTNANMLMYWRLLRRAIERGSHTFDFGRSSADSSTYRFKKQWGAVPHASAWQYYLRQGEANQLRLDSGKFDLAVRLWRRLPVWLTRLVGPSIVRGIP